MAPTLPSLVLLLTTTSLATSFSHQKRQEIPDPPNKERAEVAAQYNPPNVNLKKCQGLEYKYPNGYNPAVGNTRCEELLEVGECNTEGNGFVCGPDYDHVQRCEHGEVVEERFEQCKLALSCATSAFGEYAGCLLG